MGRNIVRRNIGAYFYLYSNALFHFIFSIQYQKY